MAADSVLLDESSTVRSRTRVMSCDARVAVTTDEPGVDADRIARAAIRRLHELERRWSRFLPDSEISRLNAAPTVLRRVSADTFRLVEALVQAWRESDGAFDPTLLGAIVHLGYGASRDRADRRTSLAAGARSRGRPDLVRTRCADHAVLLGEGTALDPGGLGKGLAADIVAAEIMAAGAAGALVEIGGDLRVRGRPPGTGWPIAIDDVGDVVLVVDGGVATSSSRLRTWRRGGREHHHLVDPTTLVSTATDVEVCTVIANSAAWADALTKIAFCRGATRALADFESRGLAASLVTPGGVLQTTAWREFRR